MRPLITVIIPAYNAASYLRFAIDPLLRQTYDNIEIIAVDDGSTDETGSILDGYASGDGRVRVIHQENRGQSAARNSALDVMRGEYVTFADSDDMPDEDYIGYLYGLIDRYKADISVCSHVTTGEDDASFDPGKTKERVDLYSGEEALALQNYQRKITNFVWGKMFRSSLFDGVRFPQGRIFEELGTNYKLYLKSAKVAVGHEVHYGYRIRQGSTMRSAFTEARMDRIILSREIAGAVSDRPERLRKSAVSRLFVSAVQVLNDMDIDDNRFVSEYNEICEIIKKLGGKVALDPDAKPRNRVIASVSKVTGPRGLKKFGKLYKKVFRD